MLNYQIKEDTVNLTFSKDLLSSPEIVQFIKILRVKERLTTSQLNSEDTLQLDDELKTDWRQKNKDAFLGKIQ